MPEAPEPPEANRTNSLSNLWPLLTAKEEIIGAEWNWGNPVDLPFEIKGNIIDDKAVQDKVGYDCYDIVVANILAPVLVELTPVIVSQMKKGAVYITSGIINGKEDSVKEAMISAGLTVVETTYQGEWVNVTARKDN